MIVAILIGWVIGFFIAIPPGPLSLTVFTYAIQRGSRAALLIAAGGMVFEVTYALLGFMGIRLIEDLGLGTALRIVSCVVILALGIKHTFGKARLEARPVAHGIQGTGRLVGLGLLLTGAAPSIGAAYLVMAGVVRSLDYVPQSFPNNLAASVAAGVGSMSWIVCALLIIRRTRESLSPNVMRSIAKGSGILLLGVGIYYVIDLILLIV
jgi:threonine/homoserine/homoserine lactone efflux protein